MDINKIIYISFIFTILSMGLSASLLFRLVAIFSTDAYLESSQRAVQAANKKKLVNQFIYFFLTSSAGFISFLTFSNFTIISPSYNNLFHTLLVAISAFLYISSVLHLGEGLKLRRLFKKQSFLTNQTTPPPIDENIFKTKQYYLHTVGATFSYVMFYIVDNKVSFTMFTILCLHIIYVLCSALKYVNQNYSTENVIYYLLILTSLSVASMLAISYYLGIAIYPVLVIATQVINYLLWSVALMFLIMSDNAYVHYKNSVKDPLTGIYNRRYFSTQLDKLYSNTESVDNKTALIVCDIDDFKKVNDKYGHDVGDVAIQHFVRLLQLELRKGDVIARVGGEEFAIILPNTDLQVARKVAQNMCKKTQATSLKLSYSKKTGADIQTKTDSSICGQEDTQDTYLNDVITLVVTGSFGVTASNYEYVPSETLYKQADTAMYQSKKTGKNKVTAYEAYLQ